VPEVWDYTEGENRVCGFSPDIHKVLQTILRDKYDVLLVFPLFVAHTLTIFQDVLLGGLLLRAFLWKMFLYEHHGSVKPFSRLQAKGWGLLKRN
jgi:hypothetical protein